MNLRESLILHEGVRLRPYLDCCGKPWRQCTCRTKGYLTIGVGRNLDTVGISKAEADLLLDNDIAKHTDAVRRAIPWAETLDEVRFAVLVEMAFNVGLRGLLDFQRMLAALEQQDYTAAAMEMIDSEWATQVGGRAMLLARRMETGAWA